MQLRQPKLARGQIGIGESVSVIVDVNRAEIIRPLRFEQVQLAHRPGADDLRDVAIDDLSRLRLARLIADRDALSRFDQLGDVILGGVIGHAAHRHLIALGQRDVEQGRCFLRVFEKQLVKIAQPEKQQRVGRNAFPQPLILLHHGSEALGHALNLKSAAGNCEFRIRAQGGPPGGNPFSGGKKTSKGI